LAEGVEMTKHVTLRTWLLGAINFVEVVLRDKRLGERIPARKDVLPNPPRLMEGRKLFVIKPASSAVYNKYNKEMLSYFR
jgi:hypothetical protein